MAIIVEAPPRIEKPKPNGWKKQGSGYVFKFADTLVKLNPDGAGWLMTAKLNGKWYRGVRDTLEAVVKLADKTLFTVDKAGWLECRDWRIVLEPWEGDLNL